MSAAAPIIGKLDSIILTPDKILIGFKTSRLMSFALKNEKPKYLLYKMRANLNVVMHAMKVTNIAMQLCYFLTVHSINSESL